MNDKPILDAAGNPIRRNESASGRIVRTGARTKALTVALAAGLALVAGVATNVEKITRFINGEIKPKAVLETTEIVVDSYRKDNTALVDFRVLNSGNKTVVVNAVIFKAYYVKSESTNGLLNVSATYDLDISSIRKEGDTAEVTVSHAIKPNEADRFVVRLVAKDLAGGEFRKWGFEISFRTSEGVVHAGLIPKDPFSTDFVMLPWNLELSRMPPHLHPALQGRPSDR